MSFSFTRLMYLRFIIIFFPVFPFSSSLRCSLRFRRKKKVFGSFLNKVWKYYEINWPISFRIYIRKWFKFRRFLIVCCRRFISFENEFLAHHKRLAKRKSIKVQNFWPLKIAHVRHFVLVSACFNKLFMIVECEQKLEHTYYIHIYNENT